MAEQLTIPIKIIMVGAMNVGKTSLVTKFATGKTPGQTNTPSIYSPYTQTNRLSRPLMSASVKI